MAKGLFPQPGETAGNDEEAHAVHYVAGGIVLSKNLGELWASWPVEKGRL